MQNPLARDLDHILEHTATLWASFRNEHVLITGGTGFVGTWLLESLAWANDRLGLNAEAIVLTRNPQAFYSKSPYAANHPSIRLLAGSAHDFEYPRNHCRFVVHAVTDQILPTREEPSGTLDRELRATRGILEYVRERTPERFLFTSSGAVYGRQPSALTHVPEDYPGAPPPLEMSSAYGEAKRVSEFLCSAYAREFGFAAVIARLFAHSGAYLPLNINFAIGNFVRDVLAGGPINIQGDGTPYRSYLYAADLTIWLWHLLVRGESLRPYNVGSGKDISIHDLAELVVTTLVPGMPIKIARTPVPGAPAVRYVPSVDRITTELGVRELIPLDEQIRRMYEWNRARSAPAASFP